MPVDKPPQSEATSIAELYCPDCLSQSVSIDTRIARDFDSETEKATHAAKCGNEQCGTNRIAPPKIARQIDESGFAQDDNSSRISIGNPTERLKKLGDLNASVILIALLLASAATIMTVGVPGSGGQGTAKAATSSEVGEIQQTGTNITEYDAAGNWTIYGSDGQYVVSGEYNGTIVYLTPDGELAPQPAYYENLTTARQAAQQWGEADENETVQISPTSALDTTPFRIFEINGAYVIGAEVNGTIQYLHPSMNVSESPYFYENRTAAKRVLLKWTTLRHGINIEGWNFDTNLENTDASRSDFTGPFNEIGTVDLRADLLEWQPPGEYETWESGNWTIINVGSSYYAVGLQNESLVYLDGDGSISNQPTGFQSLDSVQNVVGQADYTVSPVNTTTSYTIAETLNPDTEGSNVDSDWDGGGSESLDPSGTTVSSSGTNGEVQGQVVNSNGEPVEGATVVMHSERRAMTTGSQGKYNFSGIPAGYHNLYVESPTGTGIPYTENITFRVTEQGDIEVSSAPSYAQFLEDDQGEVQQNRLGVVVPDSEDIALVGQGEEMSATVEFKHPYNAETTKVKLVPTVQEAETSATYAGSGSSHTQSIDGNSKPTDQELVLSGRVATEEVTYSGTASDSFTIPNDGNLHARNMSITLHGVNKTGEETITSGTTEGATSFTVDGTKSATGAYVQATGKVTTASTSVSTTHSELSPGESTNQPITGNHNPKNFKVTFAGVTTPETRTVTKTGDSRFRVGGNLQTTNPSIVLEGRENIKERSIAGTGDGSVTNHGNAPSSAEVTITGSETTNTETVSSTGSGSVTNDGNVETTATVTVQGASKDLGTQTKSGSLSDDETVTITVDGNSPAKNVQLDLTGQYSKYDVSRNVYDPYNDFLTVECFVYVNDADCNYPSSGYTASQTSQFKAEWYIDQAAQVQPPEEWYKDEPEGMIGSTVYVRTEDNDYNHNYLVRNTLKCDACGYKKEETVEGSETFRMKKGWGFEISLRGFKSGPWDTEEAGAHPYGRATLWRLDGPGSTTVSVDGQPVATEQVKATKTTTINLGTLEPGTHTIKIDTESGVGANYTASWDEKQSTSDLSVDANGDGSAELSRSSPLPAGETVKTTVTIAPGDTPVSVSNNGPTPSWNAEYTEITATKNLNADLNGDGTSDVSRETLRGGQSVTTEVSMEPGDNSLSVQHSGPTPSWSGTLAQANATEDPTITLADGNSASVSGVIESGETKTVSAAALSPGDKAALVSTTRGPPPEWSATFDERTATENPTVDLDNDGTAEAEASGIYRQGETAVVNVSSVSESDKQMTYDAAAGQGTVIVEYTPQNTTANLSVDVGNDGTVDGEYSSEVQPGETANISVGDLSTGDHTLDVQSDKGGVDYEVRGTERDVTKAPTISRQGVELCSQTSYFEGSLTCDVPANLTDKSGTEFTVNTDGGTVNYTATYEARTAPESGTVVINGETYSYPEDFGGTGPLGPTETTSIDIDELETGDNTVEIDAATVNSQNPELEATLRFNGSRVRTTQPSVIVTNADGVSHTKSVPESDLTAQGRLEKNATLNLNRSWFSEGKNTVKVQTPGSSHVYAEVTAKSLTSQYKELKPASKNQTAS